MSQSDEEAFCPVCNHPWAVHEWGKGCQIRLVEAGHDDISLTRVCGCTFNMQGQANG